MTQTSNQKSETATPVTEGQGSDTVLNHDDGLERDLFGKWTIRLRNLGGIVATLTVCAMAALNGYTTHVSVSTGVGWPSDTKMFIMNVGPIVVAWAFMNVNKTISTIMQSRTIATKLRQKAADIIKPPEPPPQ